MPGSHAYAPTGDRGVPDKPIGSCLPHLLHPAIAGRCAWELHCLIEGAAPHLSRRHTGGWAGSRVAATNGHVNTIHNEDNAVGRETQLW